MLTLFSSQNAGTSALTALAVILGAMSFGGTAQATESNPLLGGAAGATALNSEQMEGVEGSGSLPLPGDPGEAGMRYSLLAYNTGRYARTARSNSPAEYNAYYRAASYARTAEHFYTIAANASRQRR